MCPEWSLLSKHQWKVEFILKYKPLCISRTCVRFQLPHKPVCIVIVDVFSYYEGKQQHMIPGPKGLSYDSRAIFSGLKTAAESLRYDKFLLLLHSSASIAHLLIVVIISD